MQRATIILNGLLLVVVVANFMRIYGDSNQISNLEYLATFTILTSVLFILTIAAAISTARGVIGSYGRISAMTAVVGHLLLFAVALLGVVPGLGTGDDHWEPLRLVPMVVSALSVATLIRNVRTVPGVD